jgi:Ca-activated chloride channel family protein
VSLLSPLLLSSLALPALALAGYLWLQRRPARYAVIFPNLTVLQSVVHRERAWRRHLVATLLVAAIALLCVGVARPQMALEVPDERATVVLALDVSGSMRARDVKPTRLDAARTAIEGFLERLPKEVRVGLILFSAEPYVAAPPTHDRSLVLDGLAYALPQFGTAIGDSVVRAAELAEAAVRDGSQPVENGGKATLAAEVTGPTEPLSTVVFLSDGFQTRGVLTPEEGAQQARDLGIQVHTIALGTDEGVIEVERYGQHRVIPVPPDRPSLAAIAEITGGNAYEVRDAERLVEVYESLGSSVGRVKEDREVTAAFVGGGAIFLAAAGLLAGLWAPRLP